MLRRIHRKAPFLNYFEKNACAVYSTARLPVSNQSRYLKTTVQ